MKVELILVEPRSHWSSALHKWNRILPRGLSSWHFRSYKLLCKNWKGYYEKKKKKKWKKKKKKKKECSRKRSNFSCNQLTVSFAYLSLWLVTGSFTKHYDINRTRTFLWLAFGSVSASRLLSKALAEVSRRSSEQSLRLALNQSHTFWMQGCNVLYSYFIRIGGPSAAKFAGNQLVNLLSVLNNLNEPTALKMVRGPYFWTPLFLWY